LVYILILDVVGVVTDVKHDKNFYPDGRVTKSVTFRLNDERFELNNLISIFIVFRLKFIF
jgi:hypothetical protein